ncbi:MAG: TonB-dependent receptor plug domain-containing protein [Gammaproteobacteria bacterium]|nr:TonB-dependent receptor plug domain-containing protein [Gammaproteobacteria bacterium]
MRFIFLQFIILLSATSVAEPLQVYISNPDVFSENIGNVDLKTATVNFSEIDIDQQSASNADLATILQNETALQIQQSGGLGSFSAVSLRGASSEQVLVFLDGILINDAVSGYVDLSLIPVSQIKRIEIFRGSTPIELGAASMGGAINIITNDGTESKKTISYASASYGVNKLNFHVSGGDEKNHYRLVAESLENKNHYPITNDNGTIYVSSDDREETRNHAEIEQNSSLLVWKHLLNINTSLINSFRLFEKKQNLPNIANSSAITTNLFTSLVQFNSRLVIRKLLNTDSESSFELYHRNKSEIYDDRNSEIGLKANHLSQKSQITGLKSYIKTTDSNHIEWRMVLDLDQQQSTSEDLFEILNDVSHRRNTAKLNLGLRRLFKNGNRVLDVVYQSEQLTDNLDDAYDIYDNHIPAQSRQYQFDDIRIGYSHYLTESTQLKFNIGQYHRAPYLFELYGNRGFFHGNSDLLAEDSVNMDIGFDYINQTESSLWHNLNLHLGYFNNNSNNLIVRTYNNSRGVGVPENINDSVITGIETSASLPLFKNHQLMFNMTITDSEIISDNGSFNGNLIPGYFTEDYLFSYTYSHYAWLLQFEHNIKEGMYYDRTNLLRAKDRDLSNIKIKYSALNQTFEFSVNNIMNNRYEDYNGYPKPGQIIYLGYSYQF